MLTELSVSSHILFMQTRLDYFKFASNDKGKMFHGALHWKNSPSHYKHLLSDIATTFLGIPIFLYFQSDDKSIEVALRHFDYQVVALFPRKNIFRR